MAPANLGTATEVEAMEDSLMAEARRRVLRPSRDTVVVVVNVQIDEKRRPKIKTFDVCLSTTASATSTADQGS